MPDSASFVIVLNYFDLFYSQMFENMQSLILEKGVDGMLCVEGVVSTEGEVLRFKQSGEEIIDVLFFFNIMIFLIFYRLKIVSTNDSVENWLNNILNEVHKTYRFAIKKAIFDYAKNVHRTRNEWIEEHLGGVCLAAISVWFAAVMQETFCKLRMGKKNAMKTFLAHQNDQINDLMAKGNSDSEKKKIEIRIILFSNFQSFEFTKK